MAENLRRALLWIVLLSLASSFSQRAWGGAVVRIRQQQRQCTPLGCQALTFCWSGTVIGHLTNRQLAVLTCAHGFQAGNLVHVELSEKHWWRGEIARLDPRSDLALIVIEQAGSVATYPLAPTAPPVGITVLTVGFPGGEAVRTRACLLQGESDTLLHLQGTFLKGESGGAVLYNHRLMGVIVGNRTDQSTGLAVNWTTIRRFLETAVGEIPRAEDNAPPASDERTVPALPPASSAPNAPPPPVAIPAASPTKPPRARSESPPTPSASTGTTLDQLLVALQHAATIATWIGVGGVGTGGVGALLGGLALLRTLGKRVRTKSKSRELSPPAAPVPMSPLPAGGSSAVPPDARNPAAIAPRVIATDTPPPPQQIVTETQFAPYERDTYSAAHAWARQQMVRKYPGSVDTLETLQELIKQYLAAHSASR